MPPLRIFEYLSEPEAQSGRRGSVAGAAAGNSCPAVARNGKGYAKLTVPGA